MADYASKLLSQIVLLFELSGWECVETYAKANGIPVTICRKLLDEYLREQGQDLRKTNDPDPPRSS